MCLKVKNSVELNFDENKNVTCYKMVEQHPNLKYYSPFEFITCQMYNWKIGELHKATPDVGPFLDGETVCFGLHVFLDLEEAQRWVRHMYRNRPEKPTHFLIKCQAHESHLVAKGVWQDDDITKVAVFSAVRAIEFINV